jgi:hypothetical protein
MKAETGKKSKEPKDQVCPECERPYWYAPPVPRESKKYFGLPLWGWLLIIIFVVFGIIIIMVIASFIFWYEPETYEEDYSFDVIITEGGHYKYTISEYYYDDIELKLSITTLNGTNFDIYIMDDDQYDAAYGSENANLSAFSTLYSLENVNEVDEMISIPRGRGEGLNLIIDNRDTGITENDAVPEGVLNIKVDLTIIETYTWD